MMDKFLQITSSLGTRPQGMNLPIVKVKEEKIVDMDEKDEHRSEETKGEHVDQHQGKAVITRFHSETSESEVTHLLKESTNEVGMDIGSARIECPAKPITHAFIHFKNDGERNKFIRSAKR